MVKVEWSKKAVKQLLKIDQRYRKPISLKVNQLTSFPKVDLDIKKLQSTENEYRLRVGDYRVIFKVLNGKPVIITINEVKRRDSTSY